MEGEAAAVAVSTPGRWGTWEELLLGGAVLRHGTRDWELVASELRSRIPCPYYDFTPEVCKAKYKDLRCRFSKSTSWFEELRKRRMEELRQAIEQSESSIGSLESKLETLKTEKGGEIIDHVDYDSSRTVSLEPVQNPAKVKNFHGEALKDGVLSSSSFTQETSTNWSLEEEVFEPKPDVSEPSDQGRGAMIGWLGGFCLGQVAGCITKRRGKRKRKDCLKEAKEGSVGDTDFVIDVATDETLGSKETSTSDNGSAKCDNLEINPSRKEGIDDLMRTFYSIMEHKSAHVFLHRLDGQRKGRYRKLIRRHMDLETIKTNLTNHSTTSSIELFRDLLLLVNNALVFYPDNTKEHKSALILRDAINKTILSNEQNKGGCHKNVAETTTLNEKTEPAPKPKPRSRGGTGGRRNDRKVVESDSVPSAGPTAERKRGGGGPRRGGRNAGSRQKSGNPGSSRGRKRARTR